MEFKDNHLFYADDTIFFCSGHPRSMKKMIKILRGYEKMLGQFCTTTITTNTFGQQQQQQQTHLLEQQTVYTVYTHLTKKLV